MKREHGVVADVVRHVEHGAHGEVRLVRAQHGHAVGPGDVVQPDPHARVLVCKLLEVLGQDVQEGGFPGGDVEIAAVEIPTALGEGVPERVHALHQRQGDLEQRLAIRCQPDLGAAALEQHGVEFALQGLDL